MSDEAAWILAATVDDIEPDHGFESDAEINGEVVALFIIDGEYYALGECSHEQGPLSQGSIEGGEVTCPWHTAKFDIKTGNCVAGPSACRVEGNVVGADAEGGEQGAACASFEVKVEGENIYVRQSS